MNRDEITDEIIEVLSSPNFVEWYGGRFADYLENKRNEAMIRADVENFFGLSLGENRLG